MTRETYTLLTDSLTYSVAENTHAVMYPIPGMDGELDEGKRLLNYVWYRNVPAGPELHELTTDIRGFECPVSIHPGAVRRRYIDERKEAAVAHLAPAVAEVVVRTEQPYLQVVFDARRLYEHLSTTEGGVPEALKRWEPGQLELGNRLIDRVAAMGSRSQFTNTWVPGDPELRFGLYGPGG